MGINSNMASREVCDLIFVDYATKKPFLNLDYANVTTTELTGESLFAYGGKGPVSYTHLWNEYGYKYIEYNVTGTSQKNGVISLADRQPPRLRALFRPVAAAIQK